MSVIRKERCPRCAEEGKDTKGDNLAVYSDGKKYCHAGHGFIRKESEEAPRVSSIPLIEIIKFPIGGIPERKVDPDVLKKYEVRVEYSEISGEIKRVYYLYSDGIGFTGAKIRTLPKEFFVSGKLKGMYGKHTCRKSPMGYLFITEGEEDALALATILCKNPKYSNHDVVSIPNGANIDGKLDATVLAEQEFFKRYTKIFIALDNDDPGKTTAKRMASWLSGFISDVRIVELPMKDVSECLVNDKQKEVLLSIAESKQFKPTGIIHGSEISVSDITRPVPVGFDTPFTGLNDKIKGLRKREILTVCAASGIGKSTFVTEMAYDLVVRHNLSVCHIALEDVVEATAARYIAMDNCIPAPVFRSDPSRLDDASINASMDKIVRKMYFFNHFGSLETEEFKEKLLYYARCGVDFIILDHLSMVISGTDSTNERKEIDKIMTFLASMVVSTGVGLINVVHLKRRETNGAGKSFNEGGQVSLTDLRGSAALEQLSWTVVGLERNPQAEDGSEDYAYPRVLKNRTWGRCGKAGRLKYVHSTGRLLDSPEPMDEEASPIPLSTPEEEVASSEICSIMESISTV